MVLALLAWLGLSSFVCAQEGALGDQVKSKCQQIDLEIEKLLQLKADLLKMTGQTAPTPPAAPPKSWAETIRIRGYFQARYVGFPEPDPALIPPAVSPLRDTFDLRRMYIFLMANPTDRMSTMVTWARIGSGTTDANWAEAFVDYTLDKEKAWKLRVGQAPTWMGIENAQSSSVRLPLEYSAFLAGSYNNQPRGVFFQGPWDRGAWLVYTPPDCTGWTPQAVASLTNGQYRGAERNSNKNVALDLKWRPTWGEVDLSWMDGQWSDDTVATTDPKYLKTDPRRYVLGAVRYDPAGPLAVQGEAAKGAMFGDDFDGFYGQLEYAVPNTMATLFTKYEYYDPPDTAPGVGCDTYHAWHLGYAQWLDKNNRLTLQYTNGQLGSRNRDEVGFQWQAGIY